MILKISQPLRIGDGVALVNPAGMLPERFRKQYGYVIEHLRELGFVVKDYVIKDNWEDSMRRSETLLSAFVDPQVKAILPLCGGEKIYDILPLIDYMTLSNEPKILCGSSELSALIVAVAERSNFVTFIGPHLNFLNPKASKSENLFTVRSFWNMLRWDWHGKKGLNRNEAYHFFAAPRAVASSVVIRNIYREPQRIRDLRWRDNFYCVINQNQTINGELVIGSLAALIRLCRIGMTPSVVGKIVILDTLDMSFEDIKGTFQEFNTYCHLEQAACIIFSSFAERTDRKNLLFPELRDQNKILTFLQETAELLGGKQSLFYGFPIGHCAYKLTLPIGVKATFIGNTGELILDEFPYSKI